MLNLDRLFSLPSTPANVPNCAQESRPGNGQVDCRNEGVMPAPAPNAAHTEKSLLNQAPRGNPQNQDAPPKDEVGHSGHNGPTPVLGEVCPPNPLRHKAFDRLGTVDSQGGAGSDEHPRTGWGAASNEFALTPSAVILLLASARLKGADRSKRTVLLLDLETWHLENGQGTGR